jgi:hypothetical protein
MEVFELLLDENELNPIGVYEIGLVKYPAIEKNFVAMSKQEKQQKEYVFAKVGEKHMLFGPAMIPNKKITRYNDNGDEYQVFYKSETVEKVAKNFMKQYNQANITFEHEEFVGGVTVVESWVVSDPSNDKSNMLGFTDLPAGTWMMGMYVENLEVWEKVKMGAIQGFSIEGWFLDKLVKNSVQELSEDDKILAEIKALLEEK